MKRPTTKPADERLSPAELAAIAQRAQDGPRRDDASVVLAAYAQSRRDVLALLAELRRPVQGRLV